MIYLVALDPGKWVCGLSIWERHADGTNVHVVSMSVVYPEQGRHRPSVMARAVKYAVKANATKAAPVYWYVEKMQSYRDRRSTHADLDTLREVVRALRVHKSRLTEYTPSAWKANVPKHIHHRRVLAYMNAHNPGANVEHQEDALDALGLALFGQGLLGRGGKLLEPQSLAQEARGDLGQDAEDD